MNSPKPMDPPPSQPGVASLPTLGSVLGSLIGSIVASKGKLDPVSTGAVVAGFTGLVTAVFHWLGSKLGVAL